MCSTVIRRILASGAFAVRETETYLVVLIWVYENNGHFTHFNLIIRSISYLYLLYIPQDVHPWSGTLSCMISSLSTSTHIYRNYRLHVRFCGPSVFPVRLVFPVRKPFWMDKSFKANQRGTGTVFFRWSHPVPNPNQARRIG